MDRVEAVVDDFSSENSLGNRENVGDKVVEHIDEGFFDYVCRLTDLLMGKSEFLRVLPLFNGSEVSMRDLHTDTLG